MDQSTTDPTQLNQSALQNILGGSTPSLIPDSLVTTLTISFIVLNVLSLLFVVFYIINAVRKWKVQSAVLHLQKDVADIKASLDAQNKPTAVPVSIPAPAQSNAVIAQNELSDRDQPPTNLS